jgi:hypothetical protein
MAYSNFTLAKVKEDFGLTVDETQNLFIKVEWLPYRKCDRIV